MSETGDQLVAFYCPRCRREFGVGASKLKPGATYCGWCYLGDRVKIEVIRDVTAEGEGYSFEEPRVT